MPDAIINIGTVMLQATKLSVLPRITLLYAVINAVVVEIFRLLKVFQPQGFLFYVYIHVVVVIIPRLTRKKRYIRAATYNVI